VDLLSSAIETMHTGRPSASRLRVGASWCYQFAPYDGAGFHVLLRGTGWLIPEIAQPVRLSAGDVALLPHGRPHLLSSTPEGGDAVPFEMAVTESAGPTEFLCGKYYLDRSLAHPLFTGLPEVIHLPARIGRHAGLHNAIALLGSEVHEDRPGKDSAIPRLLDLLFVYMARAWLADNSGAGWPRALHDPQIAAALNALHADPARPWRIEDLAAHVGLSRATLARRFTALTGQPPMTYLTWWRMTTAGQLLRTTDLPLPKIARRAGYSSAFAFSHAFKRHFGVPPRQYRSPDGGFAQIGPGDADAHRDSADGDYLGSGPVGYSSANGA
jgi:AraC-like DNA-binding protein